MRLHRWLRSGTCAGLLCFASACETTTTSFDYSRYLDYMPRSILVLPPLDESPEVHATYEYLATVTVPLAEAGYYVFPVAMVDAMLRENGLPTPGEMHQVSLTKLHEVFGTDSVLYVTIKEWGTSYQVLESRTTVRVVGRLVDVRSGEELWRGEQTATRGSNDNNQGGITGALMGALINQIATDVADPAPELSRQCNNALYCGGSSRLLNGHYHPDYQKDQEEHRAALAKTATTAK